MATPAERRPEKPGPAPLEGRLSAISLFDLAQFLMLNRKTGNLTVKSGQRVAYFTFRDGQLMTALDDALRDGEAVLLQAVQWTEGSFEFQPGPVPADRRVQASTENLLLEAARQLDELRAGVVGGGEDAEPHPRSQQESFRETQAKVAELSDAFRSAFAGATSAPQATKWKDHLIRTLVEGEGERILLGSDGRVHLVRASGASLVEGVTSEAVEDWRRELLPPASFKLPIRIVQYGPHRLWVGFHPSPQGDWLSVSIPSSHLPGWEELGLTDELAGSLGEISGRALLVGSPGIALARTALAAWISRRARVVHDVGWVIEPWPHFDLSSVPGRISTYPTTSVRDRGDLSRLCDLSGAGFLAVLGVRRGELLREAFELAADGIQVVVSMVADSLPEALRSLEARMEQSAGVADPHLFLRRWIGGVWLVRPGPDGGLPLQSGYLRTPDSDGKVPRG